MEELNAVSSSPADHSLVYSEYFYQFIVSLAGDVIFYCKLNRYHFINHVSVKVLCSWVVYCPFWRDIRSITTGALTQIYVALFSWCCAIFIILEF